MMLDFHFQNINIQAIYRGLFLISPGDSNKSEIGDLVRDTQDLHYRVNFNGGRLGTPGLEVYIEYVPSRRSAKISFEPGVSHGPNFHLHSFSAECLGRPGGGGHIYDKKSITSTTYRGLNRLPIPTGNRHSDGANVSPLLDPEVSILNIEKLHL